MSEADDDTRAVSPWWTLPEAAKYARCSPEHLRRALFSGDLEGSRVGARGRWLVHVDSLEAWLRGQPARAVPAPIVTRRRPKREAEPR